MINRNRTRNQIKDTLCRNRQNCICGSVIIKVDLQNQTGKQVSLTTTIKTLKQYDLTIISTGVYEFLIGTYEANERAVTKWQDKREYINSDYILNDTSSKINITKSELNSKIITVESEIKKYFSNPNNKYVVGQYMWTDGSNPGPGWVRQYNESKYRRLTLLIDYGGPSSGIISGEAKRFTQKIDLEYK